MFLAIYRNYSKFSDAKNNLGSENLATEINPYVPNVRKHRY